MLKEKKKVSIYTIGEELGISPGTVSRALSNHPSISAETRAKVKPLAEKYNFKPRFVSARPINICMLVQTFKGHPLGIEGFVALTMEGAAEYCREENLELSIYSSTPEEMNQGDIVRELRRRTASGAIILCATDESDYLDQMAEQRFPYFGIDHQSKNSSDRMLFFDNEKMGYLATKHLLSLGHRTIGIIYDSIHMKAAKARYQGYLNALAEAGLAPQDRLSFSADPVPLSFRSTMELGMEGIETFLKRAPDMTAVFACDDKIAYGVMTWLQLNQISIPQQMSVIGISDYPGSKFVYPPLTTIRIPYKEVGYETARQVHRLCRGMEVYLKREVLDGLSPRLVVRQSTGPVRETDSGK